MTLQTLLRVLIAVLLTTGPTLKASAKELRCVYAVSQETVQGKPTQATGSDQAGKPPRPEVKSYTMTLALGDHYFFYIVDNQEVIFDYQAKRFYSLILKDRTYWDGSLYAVVASNVLELNHRRGIAEGFKAAKMALPAEFDQFNLESLFGRRLPGDVGKPGTPTVETTPRGKGWVCVRDGKTLVEFTPSEHAVPESYRRSLSHFLIHFCNIHPELRKQIEASGKVPALLTYRVQDMNRSTTVSFRLKSVSESQEVWAAVPKGFTKYVDPKDPLAAVITQFERAVKDSKPPTEDGMRQFVKDSLRGGKVLDAYLAWHEYFLQTGEGNRDLFGRISEAADEEVRFLIAYLRGEEQEGRRLNETLDSLERRNPQKKYILGVIRANVLAHAGRLQEAIVLQKKALDANPYLAAVYYDMGSAAYSDFYFPWAWRCFEMARKLAPKHSVLRQLDELQARFEKDFPDDF